MLLVENNIPPEISGHSADSEFLNNTYPEAIDEEGELSKESFGWLLRYSELQKQIKELQEEADYIKNRVKLEAKELKVLKNDIIKVTMPTIRKISFDSKAFAIDYPDLYEKYKNKESSYRSFIVTTLRRE